MKPRDQGDAGELSAMCWLVDQGWHVYLPLGHSPDIDMVARRDGEMIGVQVKTTTFHRRGRYEVSICTTGGNRSWTGLVKRFDPERCDYLFVLCGDGRRWLIPAGDISGGNKITLGGTKYAVHEVERDRPLGGLEAPIATLPDRLAG